MKIKTPARTAPMPLLLGLFFSASLMLAACNGGRQQHEPSASKTDSRFKYDGKPSYSPLDSSHTADYTALQITILKQGNGKVVQEGSSVQVHATGTLHRGGKKFWSTHDKGEPMTFTIMKGQVIDGWVNGLVGQKAGTHLKLGIPYMMAYKEKGRPPSIPPRADLDFDIEILQVY